MITLTVVDPRGAERMFKSAENIAANTERGVQLAWWRSGKDIQKEFSRQVLAKDKTGRLYIRRNRSGARRKHRASAADETPANRTGHYRKSFGFTVDGADQLTVGNTAEYAGHLELGTSRMKPRPGLANAIRSSERNIIRNLSDSIEGAL